MSCAAANVQLCEGTLRRFLRLPARAPIEGPMREALDWAECWFQVHGTPWVASMPEDVLPVPGGILVGDLRVGTEALHRDLGEARSALLFAASAGAAVDAECAACWQRGEPDRQFFLDAYAAAVVDSLVRRLRASVGARTLLCPGYDHWPITESGLLLERLRRTSPACSELEMLESGMLRPKKSQVGLILLP
jgi:hypothetical protein